MRKEVFVFLACFMLLVPFASAGIIDGWIKDLGKSDREKIIEKYSNVKTLNEIELELMGSLSRIDYGKYDVRLSPGSEAEQYERDYGYQGYTPEEEAERDYLAESQKELYTYIGENPEGNEGCLTGPCGPLAVMTILKEKDLEFEVGDVLAERKSGANPGSTTEDVVNMITKGPKEENLEVEVETNEYARASKAAADISERLIDSIGTPEEKEVLKEAEELVEKRDKIAKSYEEFVDDSIEEQVILDEAYGLGNLVLEDLNRNYNEGERYILAVVFNDEDGNEVHHFTVYDPKTGKFYDDVGQYPENYAEIYVKEVITVRDKDKSNDELVKEFSRDEQEELVIDESFDEQEFIQEDESGFAVIISSVSNFLNNIFS